MGLNYFHLAHKQLKNPADRDFAIYLDSLYPTFRQEFHIPTNEGVGAVDHPYPQGECIYFCGNSLGLQPKRTRTLVQAELDIWATRGVQGHFRHDKWPWVSIHETCTTGMAEIVGAEVEEVAIMGSLTANLHLLMAAFYTPTPQKHKIIIENKAFPSDHVCSNCMSILTAVRHRISNSMAWFRSIHFSNSNISLTRRNDTFHGPYSLRNLRACGINGTLTPPRNSILHRTSL